MPTIPIRSFGGVVTAKDEAMLWRGPRYLCPTDYARNVDATDLDGITRRAGCDYVTSAASAFLNYAGTVGTGSAAVTDIREWFDASQNRYLIARAGDAVYALLAASAVPMQLAEVENLAPSGTYTEVTDTRFSGGKALRVSSTNAVSATIPSCNYFRIDGSSDTASTVTLALDGASGTVTLPYTSATTAGTHTISMRPTARAGSSVKLHGRSSGIRKTFSTSVNRLVEVDVFLDADQKEWCGVSFVLYSAALTSARMLVEYNGATDQMYLRLSADSGVTYTTVWQGRRIYGWLNLLMDTTAGSIYWRFGSRNDTTGEVSVVWSLRSSWWATNPLSADVTYAELSVRSQEYGFYADSFHATNGTAADTRDDFDSLAGWTQLLPDPVNGTIALDGSTYESFVNAYFDTVRYQTTAGWTKIAQAASGGEMGFTSHGASALFSTGLISGAGSGLWAWLGAGTAAQSTSGYAGRHLVSINERLFSAGINGARDAVNYSGVYTGAGAPDAAGLLPWYVLPQGTTKQIQGMAPFGGNMYVFFSDQVHELSLAGTPATEWGQATLRTPNGLVCPRTLAQTATQLIWQAESGIRGLGVLPGVTSTEGGPDVDLSEDIEPTLRLSRQMTRGADSTAAIYRNCYWLALSLPTDDEENDIDGTPLVVMKPGTHQWTDTGKVNCIMVYRFGNLSGIDARPGAWYGPYTYRDAAGETIDIRCLFATRPGSDYALYAGSGSGHIFQLDHSSSDCGKEIPMTFDVPHLSPGGPASRTRFVEAAIVATATATQDLVVAAKTELATVPNAVLATAANDTLTAVKTILSVEGAALKMRLHATGAESPVTIHTVDVIHDKPRRQ